MGTTASCDEYEPVSVFVPEYIDVPTVWKRYKKELGIKECIPCNELKFLNEKYKDEEFSIIYNKYC